VDEKIPDDERSARPVEEQQLGQEVSEEDRLIDFIAPSRIRSRAEQSVEGEVFAPPIEARRREQLEVGVAIPVLLHEAVPMNGAGGDDVTRLAKRLERSAQLAGQRSWGVEP